MVRRLISLPFLVMTAWALTLVWLLGDGRFQLFLAPKFKVLVYAGAALSLVFALGAAVSPAPRQRDHLVKGLFLLLPILFIFSAGDSTLGNFALSKRGVTPVQTSPPAAEAPLPEPDRPAAPDEGKSGTAGLTAPPLVSISRLVRESESYVGKRISLEGLFSQTVVDHHELSAVFRYFITCCAADAMPVGVFTYRQEIVGVTDDSWVRITGRVRRTRLDGFEILFLDEALVEKREKPSKDAAYLFE